MAAEASVEELQQYVDSELLTRPAKLLSGNSALITGSTRMNGIGFAIAERFALEGASPVILVGTKRSQAIANFAETRLGRYGVDAYTLIGDITDEQSCLEMMKRAYEICEGNVNILVNNAGTNRNLPLSEVTPEDWGFIMKPKTLGALLMTREWFRIRNEGSIRGGRVIHMGSIVGIHGNFGQDVYAMANAALIGLTKTQSLSLGRYGITVNLITPGFVEGTDMTAEMTGDQMESIRIVSALSSLVNPRDIAGAALYLAGPDGEKITGAILPVDCGMQSNYTAAPKMHQAGFRQIPRRILGTFNNLSSDEITRRLRGE